MIYLQASFLDEFITKVPRLNLLEEPENTKLYNGLSDLIFKRGVLKLDMDEDTFMEKTKENPYYMKLLKKENGGIDFGFDKKKCLETKNFECQSVVLHNEGVDFAEIMNTRKKVFDSNHNNNSIPLNDLFFKEELNIHNLKEQNEFDGWQFLNELKYPVSDVLISDNYFLDKPEKFGHNLYWLLKNLLPKESLKEVNIDFFTRQNPKKTKEQNAKVLTTINEYIDSLNLNYSVNVCLTFISSSKKDYGRVLISNYFYIHLDNSFDVFDKSGNVDKEAKYTFKSLGLWSTYPFSKIDDMKRHYKNSKKDFDRFGESKNRLLM